MLILAALCFAGGVRAQVSIDQVISDTNEHMHGALSNTVDHSLSGRKLLQGNVPANLDGSAGDGNAQVFKGGPGEDGGNGGLPTATNQNILIKRPVASGGNGGGSPPVYKCTFGEYVLQGKCTKCVSKLNTASTETLRGMKCSKPFGSNSGNTCNFGQLNGLQIGKTEQPYTVSNCIDYKRDLVTLYVPRVGFNFFGVTALKYFYNTMSIAGAPLLPVAGIPLSYTYPKTINGLKFDALVFKNTAKILSKAAGKQIAINGVLRVAGGFDMCFATTAEVCK